MNKKGVEDKENYLNPYLLGGTWREEYAENFEVLDTHVMWEQALGWINSCLCDAMIGQDDSYDEETVQNDEE